VRHNRAMVEYLQSCRAALERMRHAAGNALVLTERSSDCTSTRRCSARQTGHQPWRGPLVVLGHRAAGLRRQSPRRPLPLRRRAPACAAGHRARPAGRRSRGPHEGVVEFLPRRFPTAPNSEAMAPARVAVGRPQPCIGRPFVDAANVAQPAAYCG